MRQTKRFLAGFLAIVLCVTSFSMDTLAEAPTADITVSMADVEENEANVVENITPVESEIIQKGENDNNIDSADTKTHIDYTHWATNSQMEYGTEVSFAAEVHEGAEHNSDMDGAKVEGATVDFTYRGRGDTTTPATDTELPDTTMNIPAGTYIITASYAGDGEKYMSSTLSREFTINRKQYDTPQSPHLQSVTDVSITIDQVEKGVTYSLDAAWKDNTKMQQAATSGGAITFSNLTPNTDYKVYAKLIATDSNYEDGGVASSDTITTLATPPVNTRVVLIAPESIKYTGGAVTGISAEVYNNDTNKKINDIEAILSFTGLSTGGISYGPASTAPTDAGTYTVTASYAGETGYYATDDVSKNFTITKVIPQVQLNQPSYIDVFDVTATVTGVNNALITEPAVTFIYKTKKDNRSLSAQPTTAGKYTVTASYAGNDNYEATSQTVDFTIRDMPFIDAKETYSFDVGNTLDLKATVKKKAGDKGAIAGTSVTVTYINKETGKAVSLPQILTKDNIGKYKATIEFAGNDDYAKTCKVVDVTIKLPSAKAPGKITAKVTEQTIEVTNPDSNVEYNIEEVVNSVSANSIVWKDKGKKDGSGTVKWENLYPNSLYVVYARTKATEDKDASVITKTDTIRTAQYAKITFTGQNGTVLVRNDRNKIVKNNDIVSPNTQITLVAIPNAGYYFKGWKINKKVDASLTEAEAHYTLTAKSGTVAIVAEFAPKAAVTVTTDKTFLFNGNSQNFEQSLKIKIGKTDITKDVEKTITYYVGNKAKGEPITYEGAAGTYTAVVTVAEGDTHKAVTKNITFTVKKRTLSVIKFDASNTDNIDKTISNVITLKKEGLVIGQFYTVSTSKTAPKTSSDAYKPAIGTEDISFDVVAGRNYYVFTYAKAVGSHAESLIDSKVVRSDKTIAVDNANKIVVAAPERLNVLAGKDRTVNVTVTNLGNASEKIKSVSVNNEEVTLTPAMKKELKSGKSVNFPVLINIAATESDLAIVVSTDKDTTATATVNCTVVTNYAINWGTPTVKNVVIGAKGVDIAKPVITLNAIAEDGKIIKADDHNLEITCKKKSEGGEVNKALSTIDAPDVYKLKLTYRGDNYTDAIGVTIEYVVAAKAPAKINKKDVTADQTTVTITTPGTAVEYVLLKKGVEFTDNWINAKSDTSTVEFDSLIANTSYVLYYRTKAADGDISDESASAVQQYAIKTAGFKTLNVVPNNKKLGTVESIKYEGETVFTSGKTIAAGTEVTIILKAKEGAYIDALIGPDGNPITAEGGSSKYTATYKFVTTNSKTTLKANFKAKVTEKTPEKFDIKNAEIEKDSITIPTIVGLKYLVTNASKVTGKESGWEAGTILNEGKVEFGGLKPGTDYYVYVIKPGNPDAEVQTKDSKASKSAAVKTKGAVIRTIDPTTATIEGIAGKATKGKAVYTVTNTGSETIKITKAEIEGTNKDYFKVDNVKNAITLKAGKKATITVSVVDAKAKANEETKTFKATNLIVTFDKKDDNEATTLAAAVAYDAKLSVGVDIIPPSDVKEGKKVVTYTGRPLAYSTSKVSLKAKDGTVLNKKNLVVTYTQTVPKAVEATTTAPKEVGVYTVTLTYTDQEHPEYTGVNSFEYIIKAAKPKAPTITKKASCLIGVNLVKGQLYSINNVYDDIEYEGENHLSFIEEAYLDEDCETNSITENFLTNANTKVTVTTYIPAVSGDETGLTASDTVSTTVRTAKSSKAVINASDIYTSFDTEVLMEDLEIKLNHYSLAYDELNAFLFLLSEAEKLKLEYMKDGITTSNSAVLQEAGTTKITISIEKGNLLGISPTKKYLYSYKARKIQ